MQKSTDPKTEKALNVLLHCAKKTGFYASGLPGGYEATWARDSMITGLGASSVTGQKVVSRQLQLSFAKSLALLSKNQSKHGQIPNAVGSWNTERRSDVTFNSIDSTLWYLLGHQFYAKNYKTKSLLTKYKKNIAAAFKWLEYQDPNEDSVLVQQPTMDWEDAFPHKYGRVINTEALYYWALTLYGKKAAAEKLRKIENDEIEKYLALYDPKLGYYRPWVWKSHGPKVREQEDWFDTLGNLLAIVGGLATPKIAKSILRYIEKNQINQPYPCKSLFPALRRNGKNWHSYFDECEAREPYHYLNGGIWPMIGGFYVAALVKVGELAKAKKELALLAKANKVAPKDFYPDHHPRKSAKKIRADQRDGIRVNPRPQEWGFMEWLDGKTGKITGSASPYQAWSAGAYLFAESSVKNRKIIF